MGIIHLNAWRFKKCQTSREREITWKLSSPLQEIQANAEEGVNQGCQHRGNLEKPNENCDHR